MFEFSSRQITQFFYTALFYINGVTLLPVLTVCFLLLKAIVRLCANLWRKDLAHMLTFPSAMIALEDIHKTPLLNIYCICTLDGHVDITKFREVVEERVIQKVRADGTLMYPELKMYWTSFLNYSFWKEEENFDLSEHVRVYDSQEENKQEENSGTKIFHESNLPKILSSFLESPWKKKKSPWEMLLIQKFKFEESPPNSNSNSNSNLQCEEKQLGTALVFRLHHTLGDGYTIKKILVRDLAQVPMKLSVNFPKLSAWESFLYGAILPFKLPWDVVGSVMNSYDGTHCWHGEDKIMSRKLLSNLSSIDVKLIKDLKQKFGAGYNSVLCAVAASTCARIMEEAGQIVPDEIACCIPYPMAAHPDGLVNHITLHFFKWVLDRRLSSEERLRKIVKRMTPSKYYYAPLGYTLLGKFFSLAPNFLLRVRDKSVFTASFSSFPGEDYCPVFSGMGVNVVDTFAGLGTGLGTSGITFMLISWNGKQRFVVNVDRTIFPNEQVFSKFGQYLQEEVDALLESNKCP